MVLKRNIICLMISSGLFVTVGLIVNMNIAIVSMTTAHEMQLNGTSVNVTDFNWDSVIKGYVLSSFYYGSTLSNLIGGFLAAHFSGTLIFGLGIVISGIFSLFTPIVANLGPYPLIVLRALSGLCLGAQFPAMQAINSKWVPPDERSRKVTINIMGLDLGNIIFFGIYGIMAHYWTWTVLFYAPGVLCLAWSILWFLIVKDDPSDDPKIKITELRYLQDRLDVQSVEKVNHPWIEIITSKPVWAIIIGSFTNSWGFYTIYILLPTFLNDVFNIDVKEIGYSTTAPYAALTVATVLAGILSDYLVKHKGYSITVIRKLFTCTCMFCATLCTLGIAFSNSIVVIIGILTVQLLTQSLYNASLFVNSIDVAPKYAAMISGISGTVGSLPPGLCSVVTGYIVTHQSHDEWRTVLLISAVLYVFGGMFYLFFGSGKVQPWAMDNTLKIRYSKEQQALFENSGNIQNPTIVPIKK